MRYDTGMSKDTLMKPLQADRPTIVRTRHKISDIAWGVFWGLTAWTLISFFILVVLMGWSLANGR